MANNWQLGMIAGLDGTQSRNQLNSDIKGLSRHLDKLKLYTEIDKNQVIQLQNQLKKLQIDLNTVTVTDAAINGLVQKINDGLKNIQISNINIGNIGNQARQAGQQIGNIVSDEVNNALGKIKSKEIGVAFKVEKTDSDEFNHAVDEEIRKLQQANNKLTSVRYTTNTEQRQTKDIFGNVEYENIEKLTGAVFRYNTETGEAITKTMKWAQIGITVDDKGNDVPLMGWVQGLTTYNKSLDESSVKTDTFVDKQKTAVTNLSNQLATIESKFNSSKKPLSDIYDIAQVENKIFDVRKAIDTLSTSSKTGFTDAKNAVATEITELNNLITTLQNAEYAATSLRTKDIKTVKTDEENNLNTFVEKMKQSGHYTEKLEKDVASLRSQLSSVFDANTLTSYLNGLSNLQSEFKSVDAAAKTAEKATKIQTNVEAEKKILTLYKNELKEAGVLTGDVKQKIQDMFRSLSKVDSQNGLTTWRAELKGVKAETDAVLKSVQSSSAKEQDAYEVAYKELKKLYDLKIEYAKLGSNKETDFYYGKAIADQEKVWRQAWSKTSEPDNWNVQKRLELEREELVMQDKLAQAYGKVNDAKKLAVQADKIQLSMGVNGDTTSKIEVLRNNFTKLGLSADEVKTKMSGVDTEVKILQSLMNSGADNSAIVTQFEKLQTVLTQTQNNLKQTRSDYSLLATEQQRLSLANTIEAWNQKNTAATRAVREENERYVVSLRDLNNQMTKIDFNKINTGFKQNENSMRALNRLGASLKNQWVQATQSFTMWLSASRLVMAVMTKLRQMPQTVKELDTSLVDLKKTTSMTTSQLEDFYYAANDVAKQMGVTTKEIIDQASAWSRLGYSSQEAATKMAKYSSMFASISPGMDVDTATNGLVSIMKAFDIGNDNPDDVLDGIMSKVNIIGNTAATSNAEIVNMLSKSSSAMKEANNTLEETIALETAAVEITRDDDSVGTAFKTLSMRIRGYDEQTESYTNNVEELSGKIADLTKTASTPGGISLFTDDAKTEFKSTYQLLSEISKVYDQLSDKNQAQLLEVLAGKRQGQIVAATINNFQAAEKAMDNMAKSAGNAEAEMSVIMDSLDYKLNKNKETWTGVAQNLFQREDMKAIVDAFTSIGEAIDFATDKLGLFGTIGLSGGIFAGIKNVGINTLVAC